jgi:hypothetical protein
VADKYFDPQTRVGTSARVAGRSVCRGAGYFLGSNLGPSAAASASLLRRNTPTRDVLLGFVVIVAVAIVRDLRQF